MKFSPGVIQGVILATVS